MAAQALRLSTLVCLISLLIVGTVDAQIDIPVAQDDYYDGALTSLTTIDPGDAEFIFINGIRTSPEGHRAGLEAAAQAFDTTRIVGIYNATDDPRILTANRADNIQRTAHDVLQGLADLQQGLGLGRPGDTNLAVDTLLTYLVLYDHEVTIVAHSQGAAITSAALREFANRYPERAERLRRINVITLGGFAAAYPDGPRYLHVVFTSDPVPTFAESMCRAQRAEEDYQRYLQGRYVIEDGPSPDVYNILDLKCFVEEIYWPVEDWQHDLALYLAALPMDRLPQAVSSTELSQIFTASNGMSLRYPEGWVALSYADGQLLYAVVSDSQALADSITAGAADPTPDGNVLLTISTLSLTDYAAALGVPESALADLHPRELLEAIIGPAMNGDTERIFDTVTIETFEMGRMRSNDMQAGPFTLMYRQGDTLIVASAQISDAEYEAAAYAILESITFEAQTN